MPRGTRLIEGPGDIQVTLDLFHVITRAQLTTNKATLSTLINARRIHAPLYKVSSNTHLT